MNLLKTSFYSSISTAITLLSGLISIKVISSKLGPSGIAQLGQYQNILALLLLAGSFSITIGVTKYLSQYTNDVVNQQKIISTALFTVIASSLVIGVFTILFSRRLALGTFNFESYWKVYALLGMSLVIMCLNGFLGSVLNGLKEIKKLTIINVSGSLIGLFIMLIMVNYFGVLGALVSSTISAFFVFSINIIVFSKLKLFSFKLSYRLFDKSYFKLLLSFTIISIMTNILIPINQLFIRTFIIDKLGISKAGIWQAMSRVSDYYLMFVTTVLGVYYLPKLSELISKEEIKYEIFKGYKIILPIVATLALAIFLSRTLIINMIFTKSFLPLKDLFLFQMIGDVLKIGSWLLGYLLVAKAKIKQIIVLEIVFNLSLYFLHIYFINIYGLVGASYAFALNYLLYWVTIGFIAKYTIFAPTGSAKSISD